MKEPNKTWHFHDLARHASTLAGTPPMFLIACATVLVWAVSGPLFGFSDTWQLVINTGTTIVTFLMVFLLQRTQNKDNFALQMKLNELIAAHKGASNRLIDIENLSDDEIMKLHRRYEQLAALAKTDKTFFKPHSVEEIEE